MNEFARPRRFDGGPDPTELQRWVNEDKTDKEIGEIVGRMTNQPPASRQNVAHWRKKYNIKREPRRRENLDHSWIRPWSVAPEHTGDGIEHRLYDFNRRLHGWDIGSQNERLLDEFLEVLDRRGWVIDYNRDTEDGWVVRVRDPKIDDPQNIIRAPH